MGRARNRKKARRQAASALSPAIPPDRLWCSGKEPLPAAAPRWPEGSLGDRLVSSMFLERARIGPSLLTAVVPDAAVIAADSAQWTVASRILMRAAVYDGARADHPAVNRLLGILAPVAEAELAYYRAMEERSWFSWEDDDEPSFPEMDGPVFWIGSWSIGGCGIRAYR